MQKDKSFPFKIFIFSLLPLPKEWNKVVLGLLILYNYYSNWALNIMLLLTCFQTCCENMILSARYRSIQWQLRWFAHLLCDIRDPDRDYVTENQQVSTCRHLLSYVCVGLTLIDAQKMCRDKSHIAFQLGRNNICVRPRHRIKDEPHFCIPPGHNYFHVLNGNTPWHIIVPSGVSKRNNQRENCHIIIMRGIGLGCNNSICAILRGNIQVKAELCWGRKS